MPSGLSTWFRKFFHGPEPTDSEQVNAAMRKGCCPDCGGREFLQGPEGGGAVNVLCRTCYSEFNILGSFGADRISPPRQGRKALYGVDE